MEMHTLVLSTGSNLGNRLANLLSAAEQIGQRLGSVVQSSAVYEGRAWGFKSKHAFYNQCLEVRTGMNPRECLERILEIEREMGRERNNSGYSDRIIDIDILFYDELVVDTSELRIPHEKMLERRFVLLPLAEILPGFKHPVAMETVQSLLENCPDAMELHRVS